MSIQSMRKQMERASSQENSYIFDTDSAVEMARLIDQARFMNREIGGALAGLPKLAPNAHILDLGCGPGGWVLDVAFEHPDITVTGVDISAIMIAYAQARTRTQKLSNAIFDVMDITKPLDFPDSSFDMVNARLLTGVLKRETWSSLIAECTRILRPGGFLCLTEGNEFGISMSPAYEELTGYILQATWRAGYGFSPHGRNWAMAPALPYLLRQGGYRDIHLNSYVTDYSAHTPAWIDYYRNNETIFLQIKPLLLAFNLLTSEAFDQLYQRALIEMNSSDFTCVAQAIRAWGYVSKTS
jgi:ubiquinone/menaquinone biosynthesis C-methylase UbiE